MSVSRQTRSLRWMSVAGLVAASLIITTSRAARADTQDEQPWTLRDDPKVALADLNRFIEDQGLAGTDAESIIRALHDDLLESYRIDAERKAAEQEEISARQREWYAANPPRPGAVQSIPPFSHDGLRRETERRAYRRSIEREFSDVVIALLDGDRVEAWRRMGRAIERRDALAELRLMHGGNQSQPFIDVIRVAEAADLAPEHAALIAPILDRYDLEMAAAIDAMYAAEPELYRVMIEHRTTPVDPDSPAGKTRLEGLTRMATRQNELRAAVRDVNTRTLAEVEATLPEATRDRFLRGVRVEMYPMIYTTDPVEIAVEALLELDWITGAQRETIERIWAEYEPAREAILDRIVAATRRWESPEGEADRLAFRRAAWDNQQKLGEGVRYQDLEPEPLLPYMHEPSKERWGLAARTTRVLRAVLDPVQAEQLPLGLRLGLGWADDASR